MSNGYSDIADTSFQQFAFTACVDAGGGGASNQLLLQFQIGRITGNQPTVVLAQSGSSILDIDILYGFNPNYTTYVAIDGLAFPNSFTVTVI
jgi:hypothetical protein